MGWPESGATYLTLYTGTPRYIRTFVPSCSASLESAAASSRSLTSLHPLSPQIRTHNSSFAAAVGAASAASAISETSATTVRLTPDVRSRRATGSVLLRWHEPYVRQGWSYEVFAKVEGASIRRRSRALPGGRLTTTKG